MRLMKFLPSLLLSIALGFTACGKPAPRKAAAPPPQVRETVQAPKPTVVPGPTPVAVGAPFKKIRLNQQMMTYDQTQQYGKNLSGTKIEGWIGYYVKSIAGESGVCRLVIDMDKDAGTLTDVVLENIPQEVADQLSDRQEINFSGTIQGYVSIPGSKYNLALSDVKIYQYLE